MAAGFKLASYIIISSGVRLTAGQLHVGSSAYPFLTVSLILMFMLSLEHAQLLLTHPGVTGAAREGL